MSHFRAIIHYLYYFNIVWNFGSSFGHKTIVTILQRGTSNTYTVCMTSRPATEWKNDVVSHPFHGAGCVFTLAVMCYAADCSLSCQTVPVSPPSRGHFLCKCDIICCMRILLGSQSTLASRAAGEQEVVSLHFAGALFKRSKHDWYGRERRDSAVLSIPNRPTAEIWIKSNLLGKRPRAHPSISQPSFLFSRDASLFPRRAFLINSFQLYSHQHTRRQIESRWTKFLLARYKTYTIRTKVMAHTCLSVFGLVPLLPE